MAYHDMAFTVGTSRTYDARSLTPLSTTVKPTTNTLATCPTAVLMKRNSSDLVHVDRQSGLQRAHTGSENAIDDGNQSQVRQMKALEIPLV